MNAPVYNTTGKETGKVNLPETVFGLPWNADLVHQVVVGMQANARTTIAHTKDRSEVQGGGRKPWRQKGTGRARHGSRRSPIWVGGGVTFGPRKDKDYSKKINKKMRAKALYTALSQKLRDGELLFLDALTMSESKTKEAKAALHALESIKGFEGLGAKKQNGVLIALAEDNKDVKRSFNNMNNVYITEVRSLNPVEALQYKYVIIVNPDVSVETLEKRINKK